MHNIFIILFRNLKFRYFFVLLLSVLTTENLAQELSSNPWKDISESSILSKGTRHIIPQKYRSLNLDQVKVVNILKSVPLENSFAKTDKNAIISIPFPDGTNQDFYLVESPIMEPALADKFPELKTFIIRGVDNSKLLSGRIDYTPLGFHALIFTEEGSVYIDPYKMGDNLNYISYYQKDFIKLNPPVQNQPCLIDNSESQAEIEKILSGNNFALSGNQLRTYRLALAADAEYTAYYGGTVAGAMNGIVTTINRVDAVYEKEVAIRMVLVANNNLLVFTNSSTDPYTNSDGSTMLTQNQTTCDNIIGSANYDIGHVFSTGGGGIAMLGCVCRTGLKAEGVTGGPSPIGDPFDIDYVAHEMGHEFGANHTFNSTSSNCGGGNRASTAAYEPGSGSTIMAYAGICSPDDIQAHSDAYFHVKSIDEIIAYTNSGSGSSCPVITSSGNTAPVVTVPAGGWTIPVSTPFSLTGSATDANGDALTYCWEEFDLGTAGSPNSPSGNAPLFRSFNPVTSPTRIFPQVSDLLNNVQTLGEILPAYTRSLVFRLTARDNKLGGGGVGYNSLSFNVTSTAGPFAVTSPNTNVSWAAFSTQSITWNTANTTASPVSCSAVNILLSTDGGNSWPITLASNTPNDGTESVIIPDNQGTSSRVKIEAVGNIFFDISNVNFSISAPLPVELTSFKVAEIKKGVHIIWETATEVNNNGFQLERSTNNNIFSPIAFVNGHGTTNIKSMYEYIDKSVFSGVYSYRLKQVDNNGEHKYSNVVEVDLGMPKTFVLDQNYPNPFNPTTNISFSLPSAAHVVMKIFDLLGNEASEIVNNNFVEGIHSITVDASKFVSGIYFYTITASIDGAIEFRQTKKMIVLK
jgi:hypothetical protein